MTSQRLEPPPAFLNAGLERRPTIGAVAEQRVQAVSVRGDLLADVRATPGKLSRAASIARY
jgi:hypothetical protein